MRAVALTIAVAAAACGVAVQASAARAPSRLLVSGKEFSLSLSRGSVRRGRAVIQFVNRGEDPHDLKLRRAGASPTRTVSAPEVRSGGLVELEARLRPGHYRLWCSLPGHEQRGMRAVLVVRGGR